MHDDQTGNGSAHAREPSTNPPTLLEQARRVAEARKRLSALGRPGVFGLLAELGLTLPSLEATAPSVKLGANLVHLELIELEARLKAEAHEAQLFAELQRVRKLLPAEPATAEFEAGPGEAPPTPETRRRVALRIIAATADHHDVDTDVLGDFAHELEAQPDRDPYELFRELAGGVDWCEGCGAPTLATRRDVEGVPLCAACYDTLTPIPAPERPQAGQ